MGVGVSSVATIASTYSILLHVVIMYCFLSVFFDMFFWMIYDIMISYDMDKAAEFSEQPPILLYVCSQSLVCTSGDGCGVVSGLSSCIHEYLQVYTFRIYHSLLVSNVYFHIKIINSST